MSNTIEQQEKAVKAARIAQDAAAMKAYDNETPENIKAFWEAYKAYHVAQGELILMCRKVVNKGCGE